MSTNSTTDPTVDPTTGTPAAERSGWSARRWWRVEGLAAGLSVVILSFTLATVLLVGAFTMNVLGQQVPGPTFFPLIVSALLYIVGILLLIDILRTRAAEPAPPANPALANPNISRDMIRDLTRTTEFGPGRHGSSAASSGASSGASSDAASSTTALDAAGDPAQAGLVAAPDPDAGLGAATITPDAAPEVQAQADPDTAHPLDWKSVAMTVGAVVVFILILELAGWIISAAVLFWIIARAFGSRRPIFDIGVALLLASVIQLLFSAGLGLSLPAGFVGRIF